MIKEGTAISSTVDWATFTSRTYTGQKMLFEAFNDMIPYLDDAPKEWSWMGYNGLSGPGLATGSRDDGSILRASGAWSNEIVWMMPKLKDVRPSRVDLQVTVQFDEDVQSLARDVFDNRDTYMSGLKRRPEYTLITTTKGGDTLYAGKRTSPRMVRLYDKWRESGKDKRWLHCWRYEVELKQHYAHTWWDGVCSERITLEDTPDLVYAHCEASGVPGLWDCREKHDIRFTSARVQTDLGRLEWLRVQVAPSVQRLIDAGKVDEVIHSLFPHYTTRLDLINALLNTMQKREEWGNGQEYSPRTDPMTVTKFSESLTNGR